MMMIWVRDLPEDLPVPVNLERGPRLEARPPLEALKVPHDLTAIEEMPIVEQTAVEAGGIGQLPRVDRLTPHVDQVHRAVAEHRGEEGVAIERTCRIVSVSAWFTAWRSMAR